MLPGLIFPTTPVWCLQAGDYIDNTIGVALGLATLTSAAMGQIVSDVSGVAFGGVVEALATGWRAAVA